MKKTIPHNKPIASVIKHYMDKKSGKVTESRDEIQRRFYGLDWKDQKKIMNAFLDAGKTDRDWAYSRLLDLWDHSFGTRVKELWEEHREEKCAWVIIRHFPLEYLREHTEELGKDRNYYFICRRLAADTGLVVDKDRMSATDYLIVMHHANRTIEDNEALDILHQIVKDISANWWPYYELSRYNRIGRKEMISTTDFSKVSMALYYLKKMGNVNAIRTFKKWDDEMQESVRKSEEYAELLKQPLADQEFTDKLATIVQKHIHQTLPEKFICLTTWPEDSSPSMPQQYEDICPFEVNDQELSSPFIPF